MNLQQQTTQSGFKIVCSDCGGLSIKPTLCPSTSVDTIIECRQCSAVRGTLADLHVLARHSRDVYEF